MRRDSTFARAAAVLVALMICLLAPMSAYAVQQKDKAETELPGENEYADVQYGALLLLNRIVVQRLPISEAGTAMIVILFAACLDFMVRHNNENRIRRRLRAIFMLQKQLESDDGESFLPLAFAYCHPAVLRRILAMDGDVSECVRILRQQAAALAEKNAGRFPIRPLEQEALIQLALWDLCTTKESEESV